MGVSNMGLHPRRAGRTALRFGKRLGSVWYGVCVLAYLNNVAPKIDQLPRTGCVELSLLTQLLG